MKTMLLGRKIKSGLVFLPFIIAGLAFLFSPNLVSQASAECEGQYRCITHGYGILDTTCGHVNSSATRCESTDLTHGCDTTGFLGTTRYDRVCEWVPPIPTSTPAPSNDCASPNYCTSIGSCPAARQTSGYCRDVVGTQVCCIPANIPTPTPGCKAIGVMCVGDSECCSNRCRLDPADNTRACVAAGCKAIGVMCVGDGECCSNRCRLDPADNTRACVAAPTPIPQPTPTPQPGCAGTYTCSLVSDNTCGPIGSCTVNQRRTGYDRCTSSGADCNPYNLRDYCSADANCGGGHPTATPVPVTNQITTPSSCTSSNPYRLITFSVTPPPTASSQGHVVRVLSQPASGTAPTITNFGPENCNGNNTLPSTAKYLYCGTTLNSVRWTFASAGEKKIWAVFHNDVAGTSGWSAPVSVPISYKPYDIVEDGVINEVDFTKLTTGCYSPLGGVAAGCGRADLNCDNVVNALDYSLFMKGWEGR